MTRFVLAALFVAAAPLAAQPAVTAKLGYIRSQSILESAPGRADAEKALEAEAQVLSDSIRKLEEGFGRQVQEFQKAAPAMAEKVRQTRDSLLRARGAELQIQSQSMQRAFQQRQAEMMQPITAQIRLVLEDLRAAEGYAMIFDADASQGGGIVASDKNLDLTDRVIQKLRMMPKPTLPTGAPATPAGAEKKPSAGPVSAPAGVQRPKPPTR